MWVLDEPTSAVDAETEEEIFARLKVAAVGVWWRWCLIVRGRCVVLILWVVLDGGCVVEQGTYREH